MFVGAAWNNSQCSQKPSTYTIIIYAKLFHSLRFGSKAYSHEVKQTVVSVYCPVNAECIHHVSFEDSITSSLSAGLKQEQIAPQTLTNTATLSPA